VCVLIYLDFPEVDRLADELVVLWQLFARRQLDEDLTQLTTITAVKDITRDTDVSARSTDITQTVSIAACCGPYGESVSQLWCCKHLDPT
jgi:hypothetical protein